MIIATLWVKLIDILMAVIQFFMPFDIISSFAGVMLSFTAYLPRVLTAISYVLFFFPAAYLFPLITFAGCVMFLRLGIAVWHLFPWGKLFG